MSRQEASSRCDWNGDGFLGLGRTKNWITGNKIEALGRTLLLDGLTFTHNRRLNRSYLERGRDRATISAVGLLGSSVSNPGLKWPLHCTSRFFEHPNPYIAILDSHLDVDGKTLGSIAPNIQADFGT